MKSLGSTLREDQFEDVTKLFSERARNTYSNYIQIAISAVDRRIPLTRVQRSRMMELLLSQTNPPATYGSSSTPLAHVLTRMTQIEPQLRDVFSQQEQALLRQLIQAGEVVIE